jgi:hypothetical protein
MNEEIPNRVRYAISALPISGLLGVISIVPSGVFINPSTDPEAFGRSADNIGLGNLIGIVSLVFLLIGAWALVSILEKRSSSRLPVYGLLLTLAGVGLQLPFAGIFAFAAPVAGRLYLSGDTNMVRVISDATSISNPVALLFGATSAWLYAIGSIFLGIAVWRSGSLPKWAGLLYAVNSIAIFSAPVYGLFAFLMALTGTLLLLTSGAWITASIARRETFQSRA